MIKFKVMIDFLKKTFSVPLWYLIFPFAILVLGLSLGYYFISSIYLLFDLPRQEVLYTLRKRSSDEADSVQMAKHFIGFPLVMFFTFITSIIIIPLAIIYVLDCAFAFISSAGRVKIYPFVFYSLNEEQEKENTLTE